VPEREVPDRVKEVGLAATVVAGYQLEAREVVLQYPIEVLVLDDLQIGFEPDGEVLDAELGRRAG